MTRTSRYLHPLRMAAATLFLCSVLASNHAMAETVDTASSQEMPGFSLAVTPFNQFDSSLNSGGSVNVSRIFFDVNGNKPLSEQLGIGVHFAYEYADYHFSGPLTFGGASPWDKVHRLELGGSVSYDLTPQWSLFIAPSLQFSRADDAGWGNALVYGGVVSLSRDLSDDLTVGLGVGAFSELEKLSIFPMIVINWKISERLALANPFRPGPTGPAGLELAYRIGKGWDFGVGAAYRSNRFRLQWSDTIGESNSVPAWVRLSRKVDGRFTLDCYAGAMLDGKMSIDDRNGTRITSTSVNPAPFLALALSARF
jgi:Domain of unknown function (DUF6268)